MKMNTAIRARRILAHLGNYESIEHADCSSLTSHSSHLGNLVGCYRNPDADKEEILIFENGLSWTSGSMSIDLPFAFISKANLLEGKESEEIVLEVQDGSQLQLPIRGKNGRLYDSMEMLRFLDRIMLDINR